jgi:hypothetical protein
MPSFQLKKLVRVRVRQANPFISLQLVSGRRANKPSTRTCALEMQPDELSLTGSNFNERFDGTNRPEVRVNSYVESSESVTAVVHPFQVDSILAIFCVIALASPRMYEDTL